MLCPTFAVPTQDSNLGLKFGTEIWDGWGQLGTKEPDKYNQSIGLRLILNLKKCAVFLESSRIEPVTKSTVYHTLQQPFWKFWLWSVFGQATVD